MGHFVEVAQYPQWDSVDEYRQYLKAQSPSPQLKNQIIEPDVQCTCCNQKAPSEAAALIKCEDHTPTSINLDGQKGEQLWLCADCFNFGVRPKYVKFGDVNWNKEGRKIKKRAEQHGKVPW